MVRWDVARRSWGPRGRRGRRLAARHPDVVVHTEAGARLPASASRAQVEQRLRAIDRFHLSIGWAGAGYHAAVSLGGLLAELRGLRREGAHARGHNDALGVVVLGDPADGWTSEARAAIRRLIRDAEEADALEPAAPIVGHRDVGDTDCPGDLIYAELARLDSSSNEEDAVVTLYAPRDAAIDFVTASTACLTMGTGRVTPDRSEALRVLDGGGRVIAVGGPAADSISHPDLEELVGATADETARLVLDVLADA